MRGPLTKVEAKALRTRHRKKLEKRRVEAAQQAHDAAVRRMEHARRSRLDKCRRGAAMEGWCYIDEVERKGWCVVTGFAMSIRPN